MVVDIPHRKLRGRCKWKIIPPWRGSHKATCQVRVLHMVQHHADCVLLQQGRAAGVLNQLDELVHLQTLCRVRQVAEKLQNVMPIIDPGVMFIAAIVTIPTKELKELQHGSKVQALPATPIQQLVKCHSWIFW